jgi:hypothetical protein
MARDLQKTSGITKSTSNHKQGKFKMIKFINEHIALGIPESEIGNFDPITAHIYLNLPFNECAEFIQGMREFMSQYEEYSVDSFLNWLTNTLTESERRDLKYHNASDLATWGIPFTPYSKSKN